MGESYHQNVLLVVMFTIAEPSNKLSLPVQEPVDLDSVQAGGESADSSLAPAPLPDKQRPEAAPGAGAPGRERAVRREHLRGGGVLGVCCREATFSGWCSWVWKLTS